MILILFCYFMFNISPNKHSVSGVFLPKIVFPSEDIYNRAPKHWHWYVKTHLHQTIQHIVCDHLNFTKPRNNLRMAEQLLALRAKIFKSFASKYVDFGFQRPAGSSDILLLFKRPTLWTKIEKYSFLLPKSNQDLSDHIHKWSPNITWFAHLNSHFMSKFLVTNMSIPTGNSQTCKMGYLRFYGCNEPRSRNHILCGAYPSTELFLSPLVICFQLWLVYISDLSIDMHISVCDKIVTSLAPPTKLLSIFVSRSSGSLLNVLEDKYVYSFLIQVSFLNTIIIHRPGNVDYVMKVFDGPGILSTQLTPVEKKFHTSTFQCTLIFGQLKATQNYKLQYVARLQRVNQHVFVNETVEKNITIPSNSCHTTCMIVIHTDPKLRFNITVHHMNFRGNDFYSCELGGIILVEVWAEGTGSTSKFCQNFSVNQLQKRSIYTAQSSAFLVLFSYKFYSAIEADLSVGTTRCQAFHFSPCLFHQYCRSLTHLCPFSPPGNRAVQFTNMFGFLHERKYGWSSIMYKPLSDLLCTVFQFQGINDQVFTWSKIHHTDCVVQLLPDYINNHQRKVLHHSIRAFLGFPSTAVQNLTVSHHEDNHTSGFDKFLSTDKFSNGQLKMSKRKGVTLWKLPSSRMKSFVATNKLHNMFVHAHFEQPNFHRKMLEILYTFYPEWSPSWVEVTFWMSEVEHDSRIQLLPGGISKETFFDNPLDLCSDFLSPAGSTVKFVYGKNTKDNMLSKIYLYVHADLGDFYYFKWSMKTVVNFLAVQGYELSLQQPTMLVMCCKNRLAISDPKCDPCMDHFVFQLIIDRYYRYSYLKSVRQEQSLCSNSPKIANKCLYFSHLHHHKIRIMWFTQPKSWGHAYILCKAQGASLPMLFDTTELDEISAMVKFLKAPPIVEAIFIGLVEKQQPVTKVTSFVVLPDWLET